MSQTPSFYIENMAGAPFRNLLNQILAALSDQNSGSTEPENMFAGMVWLDTSSNPSVFKLRNDSNTGWITVFTAEHPPTKTQVGLSKVPNYSATSSLTDGSATKFLLADAGKTLHDNKLDKTGTAYDSARLGNVLASQYVLISGTYANLRAQATTKADVDLGSVANYGITSNLISNNSSLYLSAKGGYDLNQMKVNKTTTVNGKPLSSNITLIPGDIGAFPANGGNLTGPINYTPNTGDIIELDGKVLLRRISTAGGASFGCDDALIIACGEARQTLEENVSLTAEELHLGSDGAVKVYTNLQSGWESRKEFEYEKDGGFKVANPDKTRQNLSVYEKSQVYPKSQTYTQTEVDQMFAGLPVLEYRLLDFGNVAAVSRYVKNNPFGNDVPVVVVCEVNWADKWAESGWQYTSNQASSLGTRASAVSGEGIIVQTGNSVLNISSPHHTGGGHGVYSGPQPTLIACRVHVWRLGV